MPQFSFQNKFRTVSHKTSSVVFPGTVDTFKQDLNVFDKVVFAGHERRYSLAFFLGTTTSGKNSKVLTFTQSEYLSKTTGKQVFSYEVVSVHYTGLFKIDWEDKLLPPDYLQLVEDIKLQFAQGVEPIVIRAD